MSNGGTPPNRVVKPADASCRQELGTSGNLDGQQRLIVKGRFLPKGFENVIRRYMNEYVLCASCKSPDTLLDRDAGEQPSHPAVHLQKAMQHHAVMLAD